MKLINQEFNGEVLNDHIWDKHEKFRRARPVRYYGEPGILDFEQAEEELDRTIGRAYRNERMFQSHKQKMRMRWNRGRKATIEWWDERPGGAGRDNWRTIQSRIDGHIKKWLGRKFDDCFSDLKRKFHEDKDWRKQAIGMGASVHKNTRLLWMAIRTDFLEKFEGRCRSYGVDESGLIYDASVPRKKRSRDIVLYGGGERYYATNTKNLEACRSLFESLPSNIYKDAILKGRVDNETILRIEAEIRRSANIVTMEPRYENVEFHKAIWAQMPEALRKETWRVWNVASKVIEFCFELVDTRQCITLKFGSPEYKRYRAEKTKRKTTPDKAAYYDRSLWASKYIAKHGGNFHALLKNDPDELLRRNFLDTLEIIYDDAGHYAAVWGVQKVDLRSACKVLAESNWYKRNWVMSGSISRQFLISELIYIIKNK